MSHAEVQGQIQTETRGLSLHTAVSLTEGRVAGSSYRPMAQVP